MERLREVEISLGEESMIVEFDQGEMNEDEFYHSVVDFIFRNINIEVI